MEQLTFLIVFIFTQPNWGFCLIHGAHHDFLRKETAFIANRNNQKHCYIYVFIFI